MFFDEIKDFRRRNGRTKDRVVIFDPADPLNPRILHRTQIQHKWLTHNSSTYPKGSVIFKNGLRLCLANGSIKGKPVRVSEDNRVTEVLWQKQLLMDKIRGWAACATEEDLQAGAHLLGEVVEIKVDVSVYWRAGLVDAVLAGAMGSGLRDLKDFVSLITPQASPRRD